MKNINVVIMMLLLIITCFVGANEQGLEKKPNLSDTNTDENNRLQAGSFESYSPSPSPVLPPSSVDYLRKRVAEMQELVATQRSNDILSARMMRDESILALVQQFNNYCMLNATSVYAQAAIRTIETTMVKHASDVYIGHVNWSHAMCVFIHFYRRDIFVEYDLQIEQLRVDLKKKATESALITHKCFFQQEVQFVVMALPDSHDLLHYYLKYNQEIHRCIISRQAWENTIFMYGINQLLSFLRLSSCNYNAILKEPEQIILRLVEK